MLNSDGVLISLQAPHLFNGVTTNDDDRNDGVI
jgi:hypothetical protein